MDITHNQWDKIKYSNVDGVPLIYLLGLIMSNWPNNYEIYCYGYDSKMK